MARFFLVAAFGPDRPGMVAGVTRLVYDLKGNIEDTSMTRLGGEFVMMLILGLPNAERGTRLLKSLSQHDKKFGLTLNVKPLPSGLAPAKRRLQATPMILVHERRRPRIV